METRVFVIDRIEGEYAVCVPDDGGRNMEIPVAMIEHTEEIREGITLEIAFRDDSFSVKVIPGKGRKEKNLNRLRNLFNKSESGKNED